MNGILHYKNIRPQQKEAIEFFKNSKKRFLIFELPTGSGKSPLGVYLGTLFNRSYILTSQKILQEQYNQDFGNESYFAMIKGVKNYYCSLNGENAKNGTCSSIKGLKKQCSNKRICDYIEKLKLAMTRQVTNSNYSYFFYINQQGCRPTLKARDCLICDEAHNLEKEIVNYVTFTINEDLLDTLKLNKEIPFFKSQREYKEWLINLNKKIDKRKELFQDKIKEIIGKYYEGFNFDGELTNEQLEIIREIVFEEKDSILLDQLQRELDFIDKTGVKIKKFAEVYHKETWIWNLEYDEDEKRIISIEFKPITIKRISHDVLFDFGIKKVILLSGTILNKEYFCQNLGIEKDEVDFLSLESDFPVENRRINFLNSGKMNLSKKYETLPKVVKDIERILDENKGKKGIIHTHTYEIQRYILENIQDKYKARLTRNENSDSIDLTVQKHIFSNHDSVLITPSMSEGVDLKGKQSEFQIIVKLPFPFLGDKYVKEKIKHQKRYLSYEMMKKFMQMCGRSVRSKDDECITYVLDGSFKYFIEKDKDLVPKWFLDSIVF